MPIRAITMPIGAITMPIRAITMPIYAITMDRSGRSRWAVFRNRLRAAGNAALMTQGLVHTLCEHALGNPRVLLNTAGELLLAGAQREAPVKGLDVRRACELAQQAAAQRWLIDGLWGESAVSIVSGEPKCCKSFLALSMPSASPPELRPPVVVPERTRRWRERVWQPARAALVAALGREATRRALLAAFRPLAGAPGARAALTVLRASRGIPSLISHIPLRSWSKITWITRPDTVGLVPGAARTSRRCH